MTDLTKILNNPEEHYPGNFDTPQRANAVLTGLCQDAANEIAKLQAEVLEQCRINGMSAEREDALRAELTRLKASIALDKKADNARELGLDYEPALMQQPVAWVDLLKKAEEVVRSKPLWKKYIDGTPLANDIAVWMANFAQEHTTPPVAPVQDLPFGVGGGLVAIKTLLGRDPCVHENTAIEMIDAILKEHPAAQPASEEDMKVYRAIADNYRKDLAAAQPDVQEKCFLCGERVDSCASDVCPKSAQPAVQEGRDWSLLEATQESLREHMAEIKRLKAAQPAPVKTYHDGKPWPVAPKPWVGLTEEEFEDIELGCRSTPFGKIEAMQKVEAKLKGKNHG